MRLLTKTIPSGFQRLDTHVNEAAAFANARDLQVLRENHNALLAQRLRRMLFSLRFSNADGTTDKSWYENRPAVDLLGSVPLAIPIALSSPYIKELEVQFTAIGNATTPPVTYFVCDNAQGIPLIRDDIALTWSSGSVATQSLVVPVARRGRRSDQLMLTMVLKVGEGAGTGKGAGNVLDSGPDWVITSTYAGAVGDTISCSSNPEIEPRIIIQAATVGGNPKIWVDKPWNMQPPVGGTMGTRDGTAFKPRYISCYEKRVASFDGTSDWDAGV